MSRAEETLVQACQRDGNPAAFEELVTRYEKKVYNLAYRLTGNHNDACDVAQEAFVRVYTRIGDFRGDAAFSTWLYRIVCNAGKDQLRQRRRRRAVSLDAGSKPRGEAGGGPRQVPDTNPGPDEAIEKRETQHEVHLALQELSPDHRRIIVLRDLQGLGYDEISQVLGLSLGTVKSRLSRARRSLRQVLETRELIGPPDVSSSKGGDRQ